MNENIRPTKVVTTTFGPGNQDKLQIPSICPWCSVSYNPTTTTLLNSEKDGIRTLVLSQHCTYCSKSSIEVAVGKDKETLRMKSIYPKQEQFTNFDKQLVDLSSRFVSLYHAAERSEQSGDLDLAGMGYRGSLEVLLKDYALDSTDDSKEKISKMNLGKAIATYFGDNPLGMVPADVVRLDANDFVHWNRPDGFSAEQTLDELKSYLEIFITLILYLQKVHNPPVERYQKK